MSLSKASASHNSLLSDMSLLFRTLIQSKNVGITDNSKVGATASVLIALAGAKVTLCSSLYKSYSTEASTHIMLPSILLSMFLSSKTSVSPSCLSDQPSMLPSVLPSSLCELNMVLFC